MLSKLIIYTILTAINFLYEGFAYWRAYFRCREEFADYIVENLYYVVVL